MTDANSIISAMTLSERRLKHTFGVAEAAKELAKTHFPALDLKTVELAALMHDFTKEYSFERQTALCDQFRIPLTDEEKNNPKLLHAKTAAAIDWIKNKHYKAFCFTILLIIALHWR